MIPDPDPGAAVRPETFSGRRLLVVFFTVILAMEHSRCPVPLSFARPETLGRADGILLLTKQRISHELRELREKEEQIHRRQQETTRTRKQQRNVVFAVPPAQGEVLGLAA
jgi:hypothetical protein